MSVPHRQVHSRQQANSLEQVDGPTIMPKEVLPDVRSDVHEVASNEHQHVLTGLGWEVMGVQAEVDSNEGD